MWKSYRFIHFIDEYPLVWLHDDGLLVFLWHQHTGGEGGLDHVDDQVIGQDVQFLHLVPCHVGASSDAIPSKEEQTEAVKVWNKSYLFCHNTMKDYFCETSEECLKSPLSSWPLHRGGSCTTCEEFTFGRGPEFKLLTDPHVVLRLTKTNVLILKKWNEKERTWSTETEAIKTCQPKSNAKNKIKWKLLNNRDIKLIYKSINGSVVCACSAVGL